MKVLMIYCKKFGYTPTLKTLDFVEEAVESKNFENIQAAFIQLEEGDIERGSKFFKKFINFVKWILRKNNSNKIILHSFAHLSESKENPQKTLEFFNKTEERLKNVGFEVKQTPFGYFIDLKIDAPGFSLARVFKDI